MNGGSFPWPHVRKHVVYFIIVGMVFLEPFALLQWSRASLSQTRCWQRQSLLNSLWLLTIPQCNLVLLAVKLDLTTLLWNREDSVSLHTRGILPWSA